jgi:hypothetical protein
VISINKEYNKDIYREEEEEEAKTKDKTIRQDNMVFRKVFKNKRSLNTSAQKSSYCTTDDEGSIDSNANNVDRYETNVMVTASKNYDYDAAAAAASSSTTADATNAAEDEGIDDNNMMLFGSRMMMDDDDDAGWDTTIHVNEKKYKTTTTTTTTMTTYSSWLTSCLNCV